MGALFLSIRRRPIFSEDSLSGGLSAGDKRQFDEVEREVPRFLHFLASYEGKVASARRKS